MGLKSKLACQNTAIALMATGDTYFWTFTTVHEEPPDVLLGMWDSLLKRLRRANPGMLMLRVLEPHASGRRWHLHVLFNRRLSVRWMRENANPLGFGRIHVRKASRDDADYVAKYLTKSGRQGLPKGVRAWSCSLAIPDKTRLCDLQYLVNGQPLHVLYPHWDSASKMDRLRELTDGFARRLADFYRRTHFELPMSVEHGWLGPLEYVRGIGWQWDLDELYRVRHDMRVNPDGRTGGRRTILSEERHAQRP